MYDDNDVYTYIISIRVEISFNTFIVSLCNRISFRVAILLYCVRLNIVREKKTFFFLFIKQIISLYIIIMLLPIHHDIIHYALIIRNINYCTKKLLNII